MKIISLALFFMILAGGCASQPIRPSLVVANPQYGVISEPSVQAKSVEVVVVSQWHLNSSTNTQVSSAGLPQVENQRDIYRQLVEWIDAGAISTVVVEGCEGEIARGFSERFNGWTLQDLERLSSEQLDNVMTHVGLKVKAKMGGRAHVVCGDSLDLIKKHLLILSDMRGLLGFRGRIEQFKDNVVKRADYVATVRDLLKLPKDSDEIDVMKALDLELRHKLDEFNDVLRQRNAIFAKTVALQPRPSAVVIGAIHVTDLQEQLKPLVTQVYTPNGLKGDEAELLGAIDELLKNPVTR